MFPTLTFNTLPLSLLFIFSLLRVAFLNLTILYIEFKITTLKTYPQLSG